MNSYYKYLLGIMSLALCGCHNPVLDYEGDCEVNYHLNFVYDMNLDWADAFPTLVNNVNLYAFDAEGKFIKEYTLTDETVFTPGYSMTLDYEPGNYTFVAWAALETGTDLSESFIFPDLIPEQSTIEDLICTIRTKTDSEYPFYSDSRLPFLYQGNLSVTLPESDDKADYYYTIHLTKDTNHVRATVQKANGDITAEELNFNLTASDRQMAWNNNLIGSEKVAYLPWEVQEAELTAEDDSATFKYQGVVADIMTGRLTDSMSNTATLSVNNTETGETIFKIPIVQYALMGKSYYETAYGKTMSDQEFLDRQSEYFLTFIVDENLNLQYTILEILSWRIVIHNYGIGQ